VITGRQSMLVRGLRNALTDRVLEKEKAGGSDEEAFRMFSELSQAALLRGDVTGGRAACGAGAGLVKGIVSAGEVVRSMVQEYDSIVAGFDI